MSKITEIMTLIEFPQEAAEFYEEVYRKIENDSGLFCRLEALEKLYYEKFNSDELENGLSELANASGYHKYTIDMLLAIYCGIRLKEMYNQNGYTTEFFAHNLKDLQYKLIECKKLHDVWGTFVFPWFDGFYKMERFALGRLQYEHRGIDFDYKDIKKKGDDVINIHIPSCGPLTPESVKESLKMAYDFFGPNCNDALIFMCHSWMLYPKTAELYPKDSNMRKFYELFDIIHEEINKEDYDLWRIFYTQSKDYSTLPRETSLQRSFYKYLNDGNHFGYGFGVINYTPR